jgi:transposase-like protein
MQTRRRQRDYSAEDKANALAVLASCNGNVKKASAQVGIPYMTLKHWGENDRGVSEEVTNRVTEKKRDLADLWEEHARKALGISHDKLNTPGEVSYQDTVRGAAIAIDKMRLLREQPTEIHGETPASIEERDKRAVELMERAKLRLVKTGTDR